jgi:acyl-CoA thioesterase FadM
MTPLIRFIIAVVSASLASRIDVDAIARVRMRVLPNDLDLNFHMTNARYLALFDIAAVVFGIRVGFGRLIIRRGLRPLIAGRIVRHRFSLRPFESFTVKTRLLWWDEKWFYIDQRMETQRGIAAIVLTKGLVYERGPSHMIQPRDILSLLGFATSAWSEPPEIARWLATEQALHVEGDS